MQRIDLGVEKGQYILCVTGNRITTEQCRGARAMIGMSQGDLADLAGLGRQTVVDFERGARTPYPKNLDTLRAVLEALGIEFLPGNGIRLRRPKP